jgi:delta14-sterol reductase/lamin-B receptor
MPVTLRSATTPSREAVPKSPKSPGRGADVASGLLNPKTTHFEFGGPLGALAVVVCLPLLVYVLAVGCDSSYCLGPDGPGPLLERLPAIASAVKLEPMLVILAWMALQVMLALALPGPWVDGAKLRTGETLKYKLNGHLSFWISMVLMGHAWPHFAPDGALEGFGPVPMDYAYDHFAELAVATALFSYALSAYLYLSSFKKGALLAEGGNSGIAIYDFFIGRELNPRIGWFDLKSFCELRPGLVGWSMLNMGMLMKQHALHRRVSGPMIAINAFQLLYVWDAQYFEKSILTTMDITTDGFGLMLAFGDLGWVPFTYSLQARFLVDHDPKLPTWALVIVCALKLLGYAIFRGANLQKDQFRTDPHGEAVRHLKVMPTKRGTKLIVSGWWGMARKINYTGDWLMSFSWCLTTGFVSPIPYFYCIYFGVLLVHRAIRDEHMCRAKYGADWDKFKEKVPYVFFPYII